MENTKTSKMENQETNTMESKGHKCTTCTDSEKTSCNKPWCSNNPNRFTTYDHIEGRIQIVMDTNNLSDKKTSKYWEKRSTEFFDNYDFCAEPTETATILSKNSLNAMTAEWSTFLAQKEQFWNYMGQHPAETFGKSKPSELLKEFGQWLVDTAEHADWDYEDWD
jgi:hypothetical protein